MNSISDIIDNLFGLLVSGYVVFCVSVTIYAAADQNRSPRRVVGANVGVCPLDVACRVIWSFD